MTDTVPAPAFLDDFAEALPVKRVQREWLEQRTDNAFLSRALPPEAYFTAIDLGRSKDAHAGALRKRRGCKPGIPDWLIVWHGVTLWIERKAGSALSDAQKITRDKLVENGHQWRLARSIEEVEWACRDVGIPLRASVAGILERIAAQPVKKKRARSSKPFAARPAASKVRKVNAIMGRYMP